MALAPQYTATVSKFLQTFFGILIISADSRLDMADVFFFKHQKSSSNMWLEPKLDPYPFRHISWCLSKTRSSTCSVSTYIIYGVYLYIYKRTYSFVCVYMYVCIYYIIYYAIMCTHDRIFIYTYTHLHMHNRFIFNLIYA